MEYGQRVAELGDDIVGFCVLLRSADGACELDGLFGDPAHMGAGVGRALVEDARRTAGERGATRIGVVANPEAVGFYHRLGFAGADPVPTRPRVACVGPARSTGVEEGTGADAYLPALAALDTGIAG